jgi:hypothetical protein
MGRVTYIHHYVRPFHSPFRNPHFFLSSSFLTHGQFFIPKRRRIRTSSRRSTLPSSWEPTCSTTSSSRPGVCPSAQNRSSLALSCSPSSPTSGGSAASHGASTVRSTTIGELDGERSVIEIICFRVTGLMIFRSVSRGIFMIELAREIVYHPL